MIEKGIELHNILTIIIYLIFRQFHRVDKSSTIEHPNSILMTDMPDS
jgi:hypothetical protein